MMQLEVSNYMFSKVCQTVGIQKLNQDRLILVFTFFF